jgi:hypothetical protein
VHRQLLFQTLAALLCAGAWAQPVHDPDADEPGMAPILPATSQPATIQPAASQPAASQSAPPPPATPPREADETLQPEVLAPPVIRLRTSVSSAILAGERAGWGLSFILAAPALLTVTAVFGYASAELGQETDEVFGSLAVMGLIVTIPITIGAGVLAGASLYTGGKRLRTITAGLYPRPLARQAFGAGFVKGLGKGMLLCGGIGTVLFGLPVFVSMGANERGSAGWDGWTWPAWAVGLAYCASMLVSGGVILGVGYGRASELLRRVAVAPLPARRGRGGGLALALRF